jgi:hypothetical protein
MKKKFFYLMIVFTLGIQYNCFCQLYTEDGLYENGIKDYNNGDWQYASIYLFALIQKNPQAFTDDPSFKTEVTKAFDYSMTNLRSQVANAKTYSAQQSQPKDGVGPSQQGLSSPPPPLRPANQVNLKKYN